MQKINSAIFRTLNSDLTVFNKTLISTKDYLKALQTVTATVYNKNGAFNLQGLLVNSSQSVSTFTKFNNAFKAYNGNLSKSTQLQNAYVQAVGKQNTSLGNYLAGLNGAKASMGGYIKYLVDAKAASIGLQVASVALNTAISMGITLAISALVSAITKWVNKEKEAREEAIENAKAAKEETNNLSELLNKYNQLSKEVKSNQGVKEDLLSVQSDLLEALGIEASQIDTLIEKYGDLNSAINQITLDSLRDAQGDLMVAIDAYEKDLIKVGKGYAHWYSLINRNLLSAGQSSTDALDILEKAGIISSGSHGEGGGALVLTGDDKTVEGILENYRKLKDSQEALNEAIDNGEITMEKMIKIPLYHDINSRLDELEESIGNYNTAIADLNKNMAQQQILKSLAEQSSIPETKEEFEAFQQSMIDTAIASTKFKGSQDDIRDSIINVLSVMPEFEKYFEELNDVQSSTSNIENPISSLSISDTITQLNTQLKPAFDSLKSAYQDIFIGDDKINLENVDISMLDSMKSKLDDLNAIDGISIDYSSFENLAKVLTDTSSTTDDVKTAFNLFATDIVTGLNPALSDCSGENYRLLQSLLESTGITNAEAVMISSLGYTYEDYAAAKKECADAGIDLTDKTEQEIEDLTLQQIAANNCGQALALLQLKKALCNETALTPGSDINSLYQLAKAAGIATEKIGVLAGLNAAYERESAAGHTQAALAIANRMAEVKAEVEKQFSEIGNVEVDFSAKYDKGASSATAKEAETDYKNLLDKETDLLEKQLAANIITFQEYSDKQKQIIEEYYRDGKIKAQDYYDALANMYTSRLSHHDKAIRAVEGTIDREISRLKDQKEAVENSYQVKIDAIQSEIDALNKANDARKAQIDLEKAQYEAERARNQRVNKVFDGSQFIYSTDTDAIRDTEEELADRKLQSDISLLEGQIDSLKAEMENATKSLDLQISALEAYKGKWNEISGVYEEQQNKLIASEILGADWETQVLNGRLDTLRIFTEQYIALQQAQADAAVNAARIKAEADAGNLTGGKVGSAPDTQNRGDTDTKLTPLGKGSSSSSGTDAKERPGAGGPHFALKMQKFHDGLDEGYAGNTASGNQNLKILQSAAQKLHLNADEIPAVLKTGELVLTPEQQQNIVNNARMAFFRDNIMTIGSNGSQISLQAHTIPNTVNIDSITISCPNVTNNTGAEYILKSLQRLPLDTLQYTHKRQ